MSRTIVSLIMAALLVLLCVFTMRETQRASEEISREIDIMLDNKGGNVETIKNAWNRYKISFSYFQNHSELEELNYAIETLGDTEVDDLFREKCIQAKLMLEHLAEGEKLHMYNIF